MRPAFTLIQKYQSTILHVLTWSIFFLLPIILDQGYGGRGPRPAHETDFLYLNTLTNFFWVILFYLNTRLLIPTLLYKQKFAGYLLTQLLLFGIILFFHRMLFSLLLADLSFSFYRSALYNGIPFLFILMAAIAFKSVSDKIKSDLVASEKQRENLKTELAFLRSQINPHFFLNVLNNTIALARMKSEALEPTLLKLSSLVKYMFYETDEEKVLLKSELEYLKGYIDLQKQRIGDRLSLIIDLNPREDWHAIEPMLLIPFVENAFKHGTGLIPDPAIHISLTTSGNDLLFSVKNKYTLAEDTRDGGSGIDLANVKRRLELLYGDKQKLSIHKSDGWYTVTLQLTLTP
ncbi:sensor histidine kinase [Cyclobacterium salsum]|uniref:sensor histidine kinase n=1 Tax=Cyclobacterium salsum TaxID=2666329 RepID=UPI001390EB4C|nr:histidine kinase [Cyclobacterium salsum]